MHRPLNRMADRFRSSDSSGDDTVRKTDAHGGAKIYSDLRGGYIHMDRVLVDDHVFSNTNERKSFVVR